MSVEKIKETNECHHQKFEHEDKDFSDQVIHINEGSQN